MLSSPFHTQLHTHGCSRLDDVDEAIFKKKIKMERAVVFIQAAAEPADAYVELVPQQGHKIWILSISVSQRRDSTINQSFICVLRRIKALVWSVILPAGSCNNGGRDLDHMIT